MRKRAVNRLKASNWLIVDCFAGGGGASTGIEMALNRSPDIAVNHNGEALAMHESNHPWTVHYKTDICELDPLWVTQRRPVGLAWFSPDCTHHSKARGGKPIREAGKKSRGLAWVILNWARKVQPRVIILENVEEFQEWGPVVHKIGTDGYPVFDELGKPWYVPCPKRKGQTFRKWLRRLQALGYQVEWKELRACDYGSPTIRKRLFIIARCDGQPIVWPEPTHGKPGSPEVLAGKRLPWRTAAEIINWSLPCPSIFLTKAEGRAVGVNRPLKKNTMDRIFKGLDRYVLRCKNPFIVVCNHKGPEFRGQGVDDPMATVTASRDAVGVVDPLLAPVVTAGQHGGANRSPESPLHTVTASEGDQNAVIAPYCVPRYGEAPGQAPRCASVDQPAATVVPTGNGASLVAPILDAYHGPRGDGDVARSVEMSEPLRTQDTSNRYSLVEAFIAQHNGGKVGHEAKAPLSTIMASGGQQQVVEAFIAQHNGGMVGHHPAKPLSTVTQRGTQQQVVQVTGAAVVGCGGRAGQSPPTGMDSPLGTATGKADKCVVAASMVTNTTGHGPGDPLDPVATVTTGNQQAVAAAYLSHLYGSNVAGGNGNPDHPAKTVTATGQHHAAVLAFLAKYYGNHHNHQACNEPLHTVTTKERFGIVTVNEVEYVIVDIGMRMLTARELFRAQGFPPDYKIDVWCDHRVNAKGKPMKAGFLTKQAQVRCAGNSVCPQLAAALVGANCPWLQAKPGTMPGERSRMLGEFYVRQPATAVGG